jgi:hypothetical protein
MVTLINNQLANFTTISLEEMGKVELMNRVDTKYVFNLKQLPHILNEISGDYFVVTIQNNQIFTYSTQYYDTSNFLLYQKHHNGLMNRFKIRHRTYVESNLGFLEFKSKNNKGRTDKKRIKIVSPPRVWSDQSVSFLQRFVKADIEKFLPSVLINYKRITLVNIKKPERVTIDIDLSFAYNDKQTSLSNLVIAEVKEELSGASAFKMQMRNEKIREGSISKYCLGVALTNNAVKKNKFKHTLLRILKTDNQ